MYILYICLYIIYIYIYHTYAYTNPYKVPYSNHALEFASPDELRYTQNWVGDEIPKKHSNTYCEFHASEGSARIITNTRWSSKRFLESGNGISIGIVIIIML